MIFGAAVFTVGAGMIYTLKVNSPTKTWIGYEFLAGFGAGAGVQSKLSSSTLTEAYSSDLLNSSLHRCSSCPRRERYAIWKCCSLLFQFSRWSTFHIHRKSYFHVKLLVSCWEPRA
jgi:hypothetical protein